MPFLTAFNTSRTLKAISKSDILNIESWKPYYKDVYYLNKLDLSNLYYFDKYCENIANGVDLVKLAYYEKVVVVDNYEFIFEGGKPSYHKSEYCPKLHSNFSNFRIPESIKVKGTEAVNEFRIWFKENNTLLENNPEAFAARLHLKFKIVDKNIERVDYDNSGFVFKENFTKEILYTRINSLLKNAAEYFKRDEDRKPLLKKYQKATFLAFKEDPLDVNFGFTDENAKALLKEYYYLFIEPTIYYLKELIATTYNKDNISFELGEPLLQSLGFEHCHHCYNENYSELIFLEDERQNLKEKFGDFYFAIEPSVFVFHNIPDTNYKIAFIYSRVFRIVDDQMYTDKKNNKYFNVYIEFVNHMNQYAYKKAKFYTEDISEIVLYKKYITRVNINILDNKDYYQVYK